VKEEGAVFLSFDVVECFFGHDGGGIVVAFVKGVVRILHLLVISPEIVGIEKVGRGVGSVAKEIIEALFARERRVVGVAAETRLPDHRGVVSGFFESLRQNGLVRIFAHLDATISANVNVSGVFAFEETTP